MKNIGVQKELSTIRDYLSDNGYKVFEVDTTNITSSTTLLSFDAVVVSGASDNIMGIDDTEAKIPVINADGLTPVDILDQLNRTL
ncbi:YkuS family protein [Clostridium sp. YIM B02515]|uniref:YkuS family protein n=1 Tax=Clostridium rhizosphaerae TaxID=2803861 RepID=A0ABS1TBV8_9CLOT|nr:YkuS family protein [Clostridium rhizosphaerae]MBL4936746.1 YkuS family protein [Clostridium rhizosphaerae]